MNWLQEQSRAAASAHLAALAAEAGVTIAGVYVNNHTPIECICPEGHLCSPRPLNVVSGRGWCRACAGNDPAVSESRFRAAALEAGVLVVGEYVGNRTPIACVCPEGHVCSPQPFSIQQGQGWCRVCAGKDPATSAAKFRAAALAAGVTVVGDIAYSDLPVECRCPRGHTCNPRPTNVLQGVGWCQQCNVQFDRVYLVTGLFNGDEWAKYGVSGNDARVKHHQRNGWQLYRQWTGLSHYTAWEIEAMAKQRCRMSAWGTLPSSYMPQDGYSETFPATYLPAVERWIASALDGMDEIR